MSWVFGPGSNPGGADKDIQFNNNGSFSGSALLTTDGSGSLSASVHVSASTYYGDGSNLTGVTASAVQVADGPEYSIQFRRDAPVTGEISGSVNLRTNAALDHVFLTGTLYVQGQNAYFGNGSGGGFLRVNGDSDTHIQFGPAGSDSMDFVAGGKRLIRLDENGADVVALGSAATDTIYISGSLTASVGMRVSASAAIGEDIFVGSGNTRTIGAQMDGSDDFFVMGNDAGAITLSASSGVEFIASATDGVMAIATPITVFSDADANNSVVSLTTAGAVSGSTKLESGGTLTVAGNSTLSGNLTVCEGTASILHLSGCSPIQVHAPITSSYNISASAFYGNGAGITGISLINLDAAGSDTNVQFNQNGEFAANAGFAYDGTGSITVSGNLGSINYIKDWGGGDMATTESLGGKVTLGGYGDPYLQARNINIPDIGTGYNNFNIGHSGQIQLSSSMGGGAFEFEGIKFTNNPGDGIVGFESNRVSFLHNTASLTGDALEYVWAINSDHVASGEESAWVKLDLSSSTKNFQVGGRDSVQLQAASGLLVDGLGQFNNGVTVGGATSNFNATVNVNNTSSFGGPATFNNHAASFNQGITVGGAASNFNANLNANSNVTLGASDGSTSITINASTIDISTNNSVITLKDGQNGLTDNGALMFFTGSGGDFMKFHTSGSAKGVVFPQETYLSKGGTLSGTIAGPGSYLALDADNKIVVTSSAASSGGGTPGGSNTQVQFNDGGSFGGDSTFTFAKTTNVLSVPTITASVGVEAVGLRVSASNPIGEDIFVGSGTTRSIGTLIDGSDDFFVMGHDAGAVTLSASQGVEFVGGSEGVGSFGSDIKVYATQAGSTTNVSLGKDGIISGSGQLRGASVAVDGIVTTHRVQIDDGSEIGTDSDTDMITLHNGSDVTIASDLELRVGNLTQDRVATVGANSKLADHSNFTFASDVLSVPTITASVGISSSLLIVEPKSGSLAGAGSYLGLNANNQIIVTSSAGDGGGTPGGSNTEVQFNDGGSFGGDSTFTFNKSTNVLSVPTITASVGIDVTSSANGSINIGEGISYTFNGDGRLDVYENEFRLNKTNLYQAVFPEQTSNFDIGDSQVFLVNTNGSVVTGTLPGVTSTDDYGLTFTIKDSGGNAGTNDIIIEPSGSQKIDGAAAAKIATNYGALTVVAISSSVNGFGWGIVSTT